MPELFAAIIVTLCMLSGLILRCAPFRSVVTAKRKKLLFAIYAGACLANIALATGLFHVLGLGFVSHYVHTGASLFAILMTVINILLIPGRVGEHLFALGTVRTIHFLMLSVPQYIVYLLPSGSAQRDLMVFLGIYLGLLLAFHWPLKKLICRTIEPFLQLDTRNYWGTILYIPLAFFTATAIYVSATDTTSYLLQMVSSLVSCTMLLVMCWSIAADHQRMEKHQQIQKQLDAQKLHYMELRGRIEEARKMNHDFKHHLAAIRRYIETGDKENLSVYYYQLSMQSQSFSQIPYTGNSAADGVLYHYMQQAEQAGIDFQCVGIIQSRGIADADLCALLGNALDNAVTGCQTIETGRSISVISQSEKQLLTVVIQNSFDGVINQNKNGILSRKRDNAPGLGLVSMQSICESYGGSMETKWDDSSFTVIFLLPLTE